MKPKYHALFLVILHRTSSVSLSCHHIASTLTSSAANSIVLYSSLFHHSLSYRQESVLLARKAAKNSPVIESILCKPISDPSFRTNPPFLPGSCFLISVRRTIPLPPFCHLRSLICRRRKVLSIPASPFSLSSPSRPPSLSICVQILNHVGVDENESGIDPTRRCRKRERNREKEQRGERERF